MNGQIKPQIRHTSVANFANSPAIGHHLRLDVTQFEIQSATPRINRGALIEIKTKLTLTNNVKAYHVI